MNTILDYTITILIIIALIVITLVGYLFEGIKWVSEHVHRRLEIWSVALLKELRKR